MAHVRTLVIWNRQILLVQHHDPHDDSVSWILPGGASEHDETLEQAARREVKEETGVDVRVIRQVPVLPERDYLLFVAELVGAPDVVAEVEECEGESHTIGAGWHPVTLEMPCGPIRSDYWAELAPVIRERLRGNPSD